MSDKKEVAEEKKKTNTVYARFPGCKGDVRAKGYDECIEFDSFQFGAGLGVGSGRRWRGDDDDDAEDEEVGEDDFPERECSEPSLSEVTLTKAQDSVSAIFFYNLCAKKDYGTIVLDLVDIKDDKTPVPTMRMVLKHTIMSGYSTSWGEGSRKSHESVSLNFAATERKKQKTEGEEHYSSCSSSLRDENVQLCIASTQEPATLVLVGVAGTQLKHAVLKILRSSMAKCFCICEVELVGKN